MTADCEKGANCPFVPKHPGNRSAWSKKAADRRLFPGKWRQDFPRKFPGSGRSLGEYNPIVTISRGAQPCRTKSLDSPT